MLDHLVKTTSELKRVLIFLGYALPPVVFLHNNKLRQIKEDYEQMSIIFTGTKHKSLFLDAEHVIEHITTRHTRISNLHELLRNNTLTLSYLKGY